VNQGVRIKGLGIILLSSVLLILVAVSVTGEQYSNVASIFELGMGARPLAMGGAFAGFADDGNALFYNPAGLAWAQGLSILSSYEARPGIASYGSVSASLPQFGFGLHYFDFGEIPETDEFGNVIGTFSYRNYAVLAAASVKAADLPFLTRMPLAENIGFGLKATLFKVSTLDPGNGRGFTTDFSFLFRSESLAFRRNITGYGFGLVIQNLISLPIQYGSGHQESWPQRLVLGASLELMSQVILAMDVTNEKSVRFGVEWTPIPVVSFRTGFRNEGTWMWSLGMGLRFRNFIFDYAVVLHPYLANELRGSLAVSW